MTTMPEVVAVIGGGRMGAGVAQVFAAAGSTVTIAEANQDAASAALERVARGLARAADNGGLEIVRGPDSDGGVLKSVLDWTHGLGKSDVVVKDSPAFAPAASQWRWAWKRSAHSRKMSPTLNLSTAHRNWDIATRWGIRVDRSRRTRRPDRASMHGRNNPNQGSS